MEKVSKIKKYEMAVLSVLNDNADDHLKDDTYQKIVIADKSAQHYQLLATGWTNNNQFFDNILIHFQIKPDGKIWLWENNTEIPVAQILVEMGIPKSDIVLGFQPPQYRQYTGFAAA
jgi:hypothetical protein